MTREELIAKVEGLDPTAINAFELREKLANELLDYFKGDLSYRSLYSLIPAAVHGSVDAVLALIQGRLPGWLVYDCFQNENGTWKWTLDRLDTGASHLRENGEAATPAVALLAATLRALASLKEPDHFPDAGKKVAP